MAVLFGLLFGQYAHAAPVSYTHLDVYKRQPLDGGSADAYIEPDAQDCTRLAYGSGLI